MPAVSISGRFVFALFLFLSFSTNVIAQSNRSADELLADAERQKSENQMTPAAVNDFAMRAIEILTVQNPAEPLNTSELAQLAKLAEPALSELTTEQQAAIQNVIGTDAFSSVDSRSEPLGPAYDLLHFRVSAMAASGKSKEETAGAVKEWIENVGIEKLSVEKTRWCLERMLPDNSGRNEFSVVWTGRLVPPRSGQYEFSVAPINVNKAAGHEVVRQSMTVSIDGRQVIAATPEDWLWLGKPIQLDASRATPIRVELNYMTSEPTYGDSPHALLYWQGPGIARQIVPADVLNLPDGSGNGLRAEYRWNEAGESKSSVLVDPNIEFAWASCRNVGPLETELVSRLTDNLWRLSTDKEYIAQLAADPAPPHAHPYFRNYTSSEFLSCSRRREFLNVLNDNPTVLNRADETQILRMYHVFRFGDWDAALDLLGTWMQARARVDASISDDFFDANRRFYRTVALYLVYRAPDPNQYQRFQDRYLVMPDGSCCLPVAYTMAYCHRMKGEYRNWLPTLESQLADDSIVGDRRVTWLLARAMAEEVRQGRSGRHFISPDPLFAGREWIDEAYLVAESAPTRRQLYLEEVSREAAYNNESRVNVLIDSAQDVIGAAEAKKWREDAAAIADLRREKQQVAKAKARSAYRDSLERRRQLANDRGDDSAASRYESLLRQSAEK